MSAVHRAAVLGSAALDRTLDVAVVPGYTAVGHRLRRRLPTWPADPPPGSLDGQHVVVTGASSGLGRRTVLDLAGLGAHVHLVVRDVGRGQVVADEVADGPGAGTAQVHRCDVSDLDDVRALARELLDAGVALRGIVHNAGVLPAERTTSAQGHELTVALHVLGPVLLSDLLLPALAAGRGRVVLVTSGGMLTQPLPVDDPDFTRGTYGGAVAYARSKRGQVELLPVLAHRWARRGVTVHATHPGWAATPGLDSSLPRFADALRPVLRSDAEGSDTTTWVIATEPAPPTGHLWHDRRQRPTSLLPRTRPSQGERDRYWAWVAAATDLTP